MDKYDGFPEHLRVPFLEKEKRELKLFMDAVLDYVKEGTGCSQTNGQFYQVERGMAKLVFRHHPRGNHADEHEMAADE